jgi:hypothetical protein
VLLLLGDAVAEHLRRRLERAGVAAIEQGVETPLRRP